VDSRARCLAAWRGSGPCWQIEWLGLRSPADGKRLGPFGELALARVAPGAQLAEARCLRLGTRQLHRLGLQINGWSPGLGWFFTTGSPQFEAASASGRPFGETVQSSDGTLLQANAALAQRPGALPAGFPATLGRQCCVLPQGASGSPGASACGACLSIGGVSRLIGRWIWRWRACSEGSRALLQRYEANGPSPLATARASSTNVHCSTRTLAVWLLATAEATVWELEQ